MTEPEQPCIRGCCRPCRCEECQVSEESDHPPIPVEAQEGLLCSRCAGRLEKWLAVALDDTLRLDSRKLTVDNAAPMGKHHKISGSPALVRLEVAALTDRRTMRDDEDDPNAPLFIAGVICSWARLFTEEQGLTSPVEYMAQSVNLLTAWWDTLLEQPWVDEFYTDMAQIRRLLDRAHGVEKPKPIGYCLSVYEVDGKMVACDRPIYARITDTAVKCGRCGRIYRGQDKLRLTVSKGTDDHRRDSPDIRHTGGEHPAVG